MASAMSTRSDDRVQMSTIAGMVFFAMMGTAMQAEAFPPSFDAAVEHSRVMNAGYLTDAAKRYAALSPERRRALAGHLDELAGLPATADGIGAALRLLSLQVNGFTEGDRAYEGSGRTQGQLAMHSAGMCLLHGRLAQAADAAKGSQAEAAALVRAIQGEPTLSDGDRGLLLRELQQSFGRELYARASKDALPTKGTK
jgi:hypothetical protein